MSKNYVQEGQTVDWTNAGSAVLSGDVIAIGGVIGVALADIGAGATGSVMLRGVFDLPKKNAAVIAVGEEVLWDTSTSNFDDAAAIAAAGDVKGGVVALEAKGATTSETIRVLLTGASGTVT